MNLEKLFEMQRKLDERIEQEHPRQGDDRLAKKILALQVELGELCNCWRGFKYWSNNQEPRLKGYKEVKCKWCNGSGDDGSGVCPDCKCEGYVYKEYNPLLEEYVDCLHFILSIGLDLGADDFLKSYDDWSYMAEKNVVKIFSKLFKINWWILNDNSSGEYFEGFEYFMTLGRELGFTWEQIEQGYYEKNRINHERQKNGY